ncbi:MAG: hypothetical protein J6S76_07325, partial [Clostridia bacterium]|nr:hypothetical protein [Clostridia bacterium]
RDSAVLLPIEVRFQPTWQIPRAKAGRGAQRAKPGIGNESLWIPGCEAQTFCRAFSESMTAFEHTGDNLLCKDSDAKPDGHAPTC